MQSNDFRHKTQDKAKDLNNLFSQSIQKNIYKSKNKIKQNKIK